MISGNFYFITDEYCTRFEKYGVMKNKDTINGKEHNRPCYYAFEDEMDTNVYWMIPALSQIPKYRREYDYSIRKYGMCDGISFGYVKGNYTAFLIQNICPIKKEHIISEYIDCNSGKPISVPADLQRELNRKARKIIRIAKSGRRICLTDIMKIYNEIEK